MEQTTRDDAPTLSYQAVDWPRVTRAVYQVRQHYRYTYSGPVTDLKQRLVMVPVDRHGDQRLLSHHLAVRGATGGSAPTWETDGFGNRVARVRAARIDHAVDFEATYRVVRDRTAELAAPPSPADLVRFGQPTALTAPDPRLRAAADQVAAESDGPRDRANLAHEWTAGAIAYQFGVTGVQTPAAMALHLGRGVCQDYSHILLTMLRLLAIPARYVSGHLLGEGAPHAWVEALIADADHPGGLEVVAFDPTNRRRAGLNYITVAVGRDYADVTPTSGYFSGAATGRLSSSKQAEILAIESGAVAGEAAA